MNNVSANCVCCGSDMRAFGIAIGSDGKLGVIFKCCGCGMVVGLRQDGAAWELVKKGDVYVPVRRLALLGIGEAETVEEAHRLAQLPMPEGFRS
jgi:hypothetical protein